MSGGYVVRVKEFLDLLEFAIDREPCVARILQDRGNGRRLPPVTPPVPVLARGVCGGARDTVLDQHRRNGP